VTCRSPLRDMRLKSGTLLVGVIAAGILLCAGLVFVNPPENTLFWGAVFDAGHPPLFGLFALLVMVLFWRMGWRRGPGTYFLVFAICIALGIVSELLQSSWSTDASAGDVLRDAAGIAALLLGDAGLRQSGRRTRLLLCAGAILLAPYIPVAATFHAYAKREAAFPVLFDFNAPWQQRFLEKNNCDVVATPGHGVLTFHPATYPGITINEPYPDWTGWDRLTFRVSSSLPRPVSIVVRIDDAHHNDEHWDRYNRAFPVKPGQNEISIPMSELRGAPRGRAFDLGRVKRILLFAVEPKETFTLEMSEVRLR
jgi:hypothetical protein